MDTADLHVEHGTIYAHSWIAIVRGREQLETAMFARMKMM